MSPTRSDPLQIVLTRACMYGRGACADITLKSAALIKPNPTERLPLPILALPVVCFLPA